ncbi:Putative ribonuclease H protein At1g65750, partial [Linum perenne]
FSGASRDHELLPSQVLCCFCAASGLSINKGKSSIFCSKNTMRGVCSDIASHLGIPLTHDLGHYLGVPILHGRMVSGTYQCILDKLDKKLSGWKAKTLSLAGRVTLALSALEAIPAYFMQTSILPINTCEEIDRRIRNFVWGTSPEERKVHLVSWEQICMPKDKGGLGL